MKSQYIFFSFLAIILAFGLNSCKKKDPTSSVPPTVMVEFDNVAGSADLALNTDYTNSSGETFQITKFRYYISNVSLTKSDGSVFKVAQDDSYFLIKEDVAASQKVELKNVPEADYKSITFTVGVDSLRNCASIDKRTGALDLVNAMYWDWNSGYIFTMLEGNSPISTATNGVFQYHIGGFGGYSSATANNIRMVTIPFTSVAQVRNTTKTELRLGVDALKVFGTNEASSKVSIAANATVMSPASPVAKRIANNYQSSVFSFINILTTPK